MFMTREHEGTLHFELNTEGGLTLWKALKSARLSAATRQKSVCQKNVGCSSQHANNTQYGQYGAQYANSTQYGGLLQSILWPKARAGTSFFKRTAEMAAYFLACPVVPMELYTIAKAGSPPGLLPAGPCPRSNSHSLISTWILKINRGTGRF